MTDKQQKPIRHIQRGSVQAAIWRNSGGSNGSFFTVTFDRSYRDAEGKWHSVQSFGKDDLLVLAKAADAAYEEVHALQEAARSQSGDQRNGDTADERPAAHRTARDTAAAAANGSRDGR